MGATQSDLPETTKFVEGTNYISFFVNGNEFTVNLDSFDANYGPDYFLVDFLRSDKAGLVGTKYMCREGTCGACTVMVKSIHPKGGHEITRSVSSCLLPLFSCDGLDVTTVEGVGSSGKGYHAFQDRLVKFAGTQCGFCSPGFTMNMYSYAQVNPRFTGGNVEYSLDGNICRCTGYRPIMDAFKSLSKNASEELRRKCIDIEDCYKCPLKGIERESGVKGEEKLEVLHFPRNFRVKNRVSGKEWIKVTTLPALFDMLDRLSQGQMRYRLIAGNTGIGVFKKDGPFDAYIDISDIPDLHGIRSDKSGITFGGGTSLTDAIDQFMEMAKMGGYVYASEFAKHFRRVASLTIRNWATLAGNLMMKHDHPEFPSDVFVLFESIGATVSIASSPTLRQTFPLMDFLKVDMNGKVILSIHLPTYEKNYVFRCFKIANRYQNCHAEVNAAMLFSIPKNGYRVLKRPSICFGGIGPQFVHATATEEYLTGKRLSSSTLHESLKALQNEVVPIANPTGSSIEYRLGLAQSLFYKFILGVMKDSVSSAVKTGADDVDRMLNTGIQTFDTDKSKFPLYQPIPKLESFPQVSGKAEFIDDIPVRPNELFGVFVLSSVAKAEIANVDPSQAFLIPGVVSFITAKDVPGANNHAVFGSYPEEIFASEKILYCGQPIGLIVARNRHSALAARDKVIVKYKSIKKPLLDIKEAINVEALRKVQNKADLAYPCRGISAEVAVKVLESLEEKSATLAEMDAPNGLHILQGEFVTRGQYHFHLENQTALTIPREDGMDVYSSTQSMDNIQASIAAALNIPSNRADTF